MVARTNPPPVTREFLDKSQCSDPGCTHTAHDGLYMHASCHPEAAVSVMYQDGVLTITCSICDGSIIDVAVKEK